MMSGGGTAGHIYPALAVAEELRVAGHNPITFVGTRGGPEARLARAAGLDFLALKARGFDRSRPWTLLTSSALLAISTFKAIRLIGSMKPDVVVGFGGYVSIPVGFGAVLTRTPLVLHEQNSVPGLANKVLSRWADSVGITYERSSGWLKKPQKAVITGNPVRPAVLAASRVAGRQNLGVADDDRVILAFGGSRGARHLNQALADAAQRLLADERVVVIHIAGAAEVDDVMKRMGSSSPRYRVLDYVDDMGSLLAAADLVIARAGATSIAEITALGRPCILVPYPYATDDHQTLNARAVERAGAGLVFADSDLDDTSFIATVQRLLGDAEQRATMSSASLALGRQDAATRLVSLIEAAASYAS
ncbi:MAG: undecaprenyldiphospho-muramoylpentapeptide beta-N-acetylglucosaminyltransferase [Coriobacteriia bacterium]